MRSTMLHQARGEGAAHLNKHWLHAVAEAVFAGGTAPHGDRVDYAEFEAVVREMLGS